jgi:MFS family permease
LYAQLLTRGIGEKHVRPRGRTVLAVLGFLIVLVGGWATLIGAITLIGIADGKYGALTSAGWAYVFGGPLLVVAGVAVLVRLHRRWRTAESRPGLVVYAWSRRALIVLNLLMAVGALVFFAIGLAGVIDGLRHLIAGHAGGLWTGLLGVVGLSFGFSALVAWIGTVRRLDHQDPLFMVDDSGIECAQGRLAWRDIDRVLELTEVSGSGDSKRVDRALAFVLRDGKTPQPVERAYDEGAALAPFGLLIGITNCTTQANSALAAYGYAPVKSELSELLPNEAEVPPPRPALAPGSDDPKIQTADSIGTPPRYAPPRPGWDPSVEQPEVAIDGIEETEAAAEGVLVRDKPRLVRRIRNSLLVVLSLIMLLVGGLVIVGSIVGLASRNGNTGVGGLVVSLLIGLAIAAGGVFLMRRLLRRRKPTEATEPQAEIVSPGATEF